MAQADNPFVNLDWAALQRQYLDALSALGFPGAPSGPGTANPWQGALDYWWQGTAAALPEEQRRLFDEIVRQSRAFLSCADFFAPLAQVLARREAGSPDWAQDLHRQFDLLKGQLDAGRVAPGMEALLGAWRLPADFWAQATAMMSRIPPEWLGPVPGARVLAGQRADLTEALREGARLWQAYQEAQGAYLNAVAAAARQGLDRMRDRMLAGAEVRTLRQLYDLWVDCGESAFGEMMAGPDFAGHFADLVNALSAFRLHARGVMDAGLAALALPTAKALGSVQEREAALRSDLRATMARQREDREQLARLQQELTSLRHPDGKTG